MNSTVEAFAISFMAAADARVFDDPSLGRERNAVSWFVFALKVRQPFMPSKTSSYKLAQQV
jgi:hypothetical protein